MKTVWPALKNLLFSGLFENSFLLRQGLRQKKATSPLGEVAYFLNYQTINHA
jgi:hypothetical protein